jgi:succinate dehydrogenase / fumarate reductase flavoprotein subunit
VVFGRAVGLHLQESIAEQGDLRDATERNRCLSGTSEPLER